MGRPASRYEVLFKLASGGMATVHVGRKRGPLGFSRVVAIKRAHPHLLEDESFVRMLVDEARLASQLHHPNVVAVLDVEREGGDTPDLSLVMEYVEGASMSELFGAVEARGERLPPGIAARLVLDACEGLQNAHELSDEQGQPLGLVHRDVSPHNILVGVDGLARVSDFGIAKVTRRSADSTTGSLKGKLSYMAPEYVESGELDARADVFGLGIVLWEALAGRKLFVGQTEVEVLQRVAKAEVPLVSELVPELSPDFDALLGSALARLPEERFTTMRAFGTALGTLAQRSGLLASHAEVGALVRSLFGARLEERRALVRARVKELDAASTGDASGGSGLRRAVDEASAVIAAVRTNEDPSARRAAVADASSVDGTLGGSGVSSVRSHVARRSRLVAVRWFAGAALAGSLVAMAWLGTRPAERPMAGADASSSASTRAGAIASGAGASIEGSDAPTVAPALSAAPSAHASAPSNASAMGGGPGGAASVAMGGRSRPAAPSVTPTGRAPDAPATATSLPSASPAPTTPLPAASTQLDTIAPNPYAH
jgi:eukaryotic-like serine/threonine-protein kinase